MLHLVILAALAAQLAYDTSIPLDVRETRAEAKLGVQIRDISFANLTGGRTAAYHVSPMGPGKCAAVLFVHWYEPESKNSNRTQFLDEAATLARSGVVSLLIETMWSDTEWFKKRKRDEDFANSIKQVRELRRALDVLLSDPRVDPQRLAFVGHDFGAMYGAVMAGVENRVKAYALQAGTTSFSDWYLLGPKLEGEPRQKFIAELAPLDPVRFIGKTSAALLFQFARKDYYVPPPKAEAFFAAAREPKKLLWYDAGHALNAEAVRDRIAWLLEQFAIP